jgi:hypothetical protein
LPVLYDSRDPAFIAREILILSDIRNADEDIVKAILEMNGIRVYRETLPGGQTLIKVEPVPLPSGDEEVRPKPVVIVGSSRPPAGQMDDLTPAQRAQIAELDRKLDERIEALRREHREAISKLLEEFRRSAPGPRPAAEPSTN